MRPGRETKPGCAPPPRRHGWECSAARDDTSLPPRVDEAVSEPHACSLSVRRRRLRCFHWEASAVSLSVCALCQALHPLAIACVVSLIGVVSVQPVSREEHQGAQELTSVGRRVGRDRPRGVGKGVVARLRGARLLQAAPVPARRQFAVRGRAYLRRTEARGRPDVCGLGAKPRMGVQSEGA